MNSEPSFSQFPPELQSVPWIQQLIALLQQQARQIQEQARQIQEQAEEIAALKKTVQEQKDEINRLKNVPKRPKFRPGGGDPKSRSGKPDSSKEKGSSLNNIMAPQKMRQEVVIPALEVPQGSRFKGYQEYAVQELEVIPKDIIYRLEVWEAPDGAVIRGVLPKEAQGSHFGFQLRVLLHNLYALDMTEPGLFDLLTASGIEISEGQVHNILMSESAGYQQASEEILTASIRCRRRLA